MSKFGRAMMLVYCAASLEKQQSEDVGMLQSRLLFDTSIDVKQDDKGASGHSMESNQSEQQKQESSQQDIHIVVQNLTSKGSRYYRTGRQDAGEGGIYNLDRHNLDCGTGVLQGFKLERNGCCQLNYVVKCSDTLPVIADDVKFLSSNAAKASDSRGRTQTRPLTRMPVQCPDGYALQQFKQMRLPPVVAEENMNWWQTIADIAKRLNDGKDAFKPDPVLISKLLFQDLWGVQPSSLDSIGYEFKCVRMGSPLPVWQMHTPTTFGGPKNKDPLAAIGRAPNDGYYHAETFYLDRQNVFAADSEYLLGFGLKHEYENDSGIYYSYQYTVAR